MKPHWLSLLRFKIEKDTYLDEIALKEGLITENTDYARNGTYFAPGFDVSFAVKINELCCQNPGWIPIHHQDNGQINDGLELLNKFRKGPKIKPAWIKSKKLFHLINAMGQ